MMGQLASHGHELTPQPADADVIVVNTCSFIDPAKQESVETILEMAEYKKTGKAQRLIVAGCLVERYRSDIQKNIPDVDAVIGTNELESITALCEGLTPKESVFSPYLYHDLTERVFTTPRHSAYIKIAEGCDHPCSFCIIPQFRGKFRSRRFESVINEATRLFATGVREINLIGQDTTCFGEDLGVKDGLAELLGRLAEIPTETPKWIRFLYAYPNKVTQKLLDTKAWSYRRHFPEANRADTRHNSGRGHSHQHDRGLSGRNRRGLRAVVPICRSGTVRSSGRLLLQR
jgi:ribosomal protein S12 methylthiotransferase